MRPGLVGAWRDRDDDNNDTDVVSSFLYFSNCLPYLSSYLYLLYDI